MIEKNPLAHALEKVGDRWTLLVIHVLLDGERRFNDLHSGLPGIAPNVLSQRLKHLEREGLVVARRYSDRPVRYTYQLTALGADLVGALRLLEQWGAQGSGGGARHHACGTPLEARWYCPTCAREVTQHEADDVDHLL
ncbi:MAG TPA: helix-turn-helix domain-containing protein [Actinomycetota bacterium]|nr:helix-turn-helix domain-containing protein [Actinomycetota bacterium]